MGGRGASVDLPGLHLSTNYKQTTIISTLSKCRKSKTVFPCFATLFRKLQRRGNCIPLPTKTDYRQCSIFSLWKKKKKKGIFLCMQKEKEGMLGFGFGCFLDFFFNEKEEMQLRKYGSIQLHWRLGFKFLPLGNSYLFYYQKSIATGTWQMQILKIVQREPGSKFFSLSDDWPNCWTIGYYQAFQNFLDLESISDKTLLIKIDLIFPKYFWCALTRRISYIHIMCSHQSVSEG